MLSGIQCDANGKSGSAFLKVNVSTALQFIQRIFKHRDDANFDLRPT
jgi:hypothetical protein